MKSFKIIIDLTIFFFDVPEQAKESIDNPVNQQEENQAIENIIPQESQEYSGNSINIQNEVSGGVVNQYIVIYCLNNEDCREILSAMTTVVETQNVASLPIEQSATSTSPPSSSSSTTTTTSITTSSSSTQTRPVIGYQAVRISEIVSDPISGGSEWVEIYNAGQQEIDLTSWTIEEGAGSKTNLQGVLSPGQYLVFNRSGLNNGGDAVYLKDENFRIVDKVAFGSWEGSMVDAPSKGQSIILYNGTYHVTEILTPNLPNVLQITLPETESEPSETQVQEATTPEETTAPAEPVSTKPVLTVPVAATNAPTVEAPQFQLYEQVRVNEFLSDPVGSDDNEWIELFNFGSFDLNLLGWTLDDAEGGSKPYKFTESIIIKAQDYLLMPRSVTGLALNNDKDRVALIMPGGVIASQYEYVGSKEGVSWSYFDGGYEQTAIVTAQEKNQRADLQISLASVSNAKTNSKATPVYYKAVEVDDVYDLALKNKISVASQVIVEPSVFAKNTMYLAGGLPVYFSGSYPTIKAGDLVTVRGQVSSSNNEKRILVKNASDIIVTGNEVLPEFEKISASSVGEDSFGQLVQIESVLLDKQNPKLTFGDESGEFTVYLKQGAKIDAKVFNVKDKFSVHGVVLRQNSEYFVFPRDDADLVNLTWQENMVLGESALPSAVEASQEQKKQILAVLLATAFILLGVCVYFLWRQRNVLLENIKKLFKFFHVMR